MPEYIFTGRIELRGVDFYITADSLKEAEAKARNGDHDHYDKSSASTDDVDIDASSGYENK